MQRTTHVFPIIGGRKVEHLLANIEALSITLSQEQMSFIEKMTPFDIGFPANFIVSLVLRPVPVTRSFFLNPLAGNGGGS